MSETGQDNMTEQMILETIERGEKLIEEAERQMAEKERLFSDIGLNPEDCRRFLEGNQLTKEQKVQARKEIQEFMEEVERDSREAAEHAKSRSTKPPKHSARKVKV